MNCGNIQEDSFASVSTDAAVEAIVRRCSSKYVVLKISQILRKTPVSESFYNQVAGPRQVFSCEYCKFFKRYMFIEHLFFFFFFNNNGLQLETKN